MKTEIFNVIDSKKNKNQILDHFLISLLSVALNMGLITLSPFIVSTYIGAGRKGSRGNSELAENIMQVMFEFVMNNNILLIGLSLIITVIINLYYYKISSKVEQINIIEKENDMLHYHLFNKYQTRSKTIKGKIELNNIHKRINNKSWQSNKRFNIFENEKYIGFVDLDDPLWFRKGYLFYRFIEEFNYDESTKGNTG